MEMNNTHIDPDDDEDTVQFKKQQLSHPLHHPSIKIVNNSQLTIEDMKQDLCCLMITSAHFFPFVAKKKKNTSELDEDKFPNLFVVSPTYDPLEYVKTQEGQDNDTDEKMDKSQTKTDHQHNPNNNMDIDQPRHQQTTSNTKCNTVNFGDDNEENCLIGKKRCLSQIDRDVTTEQEQPANKRSRVFGNSHQ
ncbi:hypothetical protein RFI_36486 [Reticulomyxa filosa]|uniref:Uncharacterized protein n=1 Tax=Reticulomyxa filosa TaxID=46433 RepID=X6LH95_RETFI|nr:hypothetical protein RFI_36486 [Reticulomyxa filosa]|eukprot:ETO00954.1 hypothetical protein RFI_36486 [Reticulomyxa filosa]